MGVQIGRTGSSAPTDISEVQRNIDSLNPLRRCAPAPLDAIKGSLWADRVVRPYNRCGGDGRPMVAPTFTTSSAIESVGAGIARPQRLHKIRGLSFWRVILYNGGSTSMEMSAFVGKEAE